MTARSTAHNDQDELPFGATPGAAAKPKPGPKRAGPPKPTPPPKPGPKKARSSGEAAPYDGRPDPEMYERLSRPWPSKAAADAALRAFFKDAHELRVKHGIRDVSILTCVGVNASGEEHDLMRVHHSGDLRNMLPMVASTFRSLREQDEQGWLKMAGLLDVPGALFPDAITTQRLAKVAKGVAIETGKPWTMSDVLDMLVREGNMRAEILASVAEVAARSPKSPAEEIGALSAALREMLFTTAARAKQIHDRIREIEAAHPELKVEPAAVVNPVDAAPSPSPKERDLGDCMRMVSEVQKIRREEEGAEAPRGLTSLGRIERNWAVAIMLHHDEYRARAEVKSRVDMLSQYLMLRGGMDFLERCREAVREERWGSLVQGIARLEDDFVRDGTMRWSLDPESGVVRAEPTGRVKPEYAIPTNIDPGGVGL